MSEVPLISTEKQAELLQRSDISKNSVLLNRFNRIHNTHFWNFPQRNCCRHQAGSYCQEGCFKNGYDRNCNKLEGIARSRLNEDCTNISQHASNHRGNNPVICTFPKKSFIEAIHWKRMSAKMVSTKYIGASISTTNESGSNTAYTICLVDVKSTLHAWRMCLN